MHLQRGLNEIMCTHGVACMLVLSKRKWYLDNKDSYHLQNTYYVPSTVDIILYVYRPHAMRWALSPFYR